MDSTLLWTWWQKYHNRIGYGIAALLLFGTGYETGRVMSPYYAAAPIIFEENASADHGGDEKVLTTLREEGQKLKPSVAAVSTSAPISTSTSTATSGSYVASKNSTLYHDKRCATVSRIAVKNQVWFASKEEAETAGFTPSACTQKYLSN